MVKRLFSIFLIIAGPVLIFLSLAADLLGIGHNPGLNWAQVLGAITGFLILLIGIWAWRPRGDPTASRLYSFTRFITSRKMAGWVVIVAGAAVAVISIFADLLGFGVHPGFNRAQVEGTAAGLVLLYFGLWLLISNKDYSDSKFFRLLNFLLSRKFISTAVIVIGSAMILLSLGADLLGLGHSKGISHVQISWTVIGALIILFGVWIRTKKSDLTLRQVFPVVKLTQDKRIYAFLLILGIGISAIYFFDNIYPRIDMHAKEFKCIQYFFAAGEGVGTDFQVGLYNPSRMVLNKQEIYVEHTDISQYSNYPPFTHALFMPLQLFTEEQAYILIVIALYLCNILTLGLITILINDFMFKRLGLGRALSGVISIGAFLAVLFYTISSYPFMFSIEIGNYDAIALLFATIAMYLAIKKKGSFLWQVLLLSIATHLKIYPAALFLVLFLIHGKKLILPALLINIVLLLSLGFHNAIAFLRTMVVYTLDPAVWTGNHSGFSYTAYLGDIYPQVKDHASMLKVALTTLPVVIWGISCYYAIKNAKGETRALLLTMVSVPLMCVLPTTSHDYKLVILSAALLVLAGILAVRIIYSSRFWDYIHLLLTLALMFFIGRSYVIMPPYLAIIANKYPLIVLLSLLMLLIVYRFKEPCIQPTGPVEQLPDPS